MLSFLFGGRGLRPDLPSPFERKFLFCLLLGHLNNEYEKSYKKLAFVFAYDIKTFEGYIKLSGFASLELHMPCHVLISWSNTPTRF